MRTQIAEIRESDFAMLSSDWNTLCEHSQVTPFQFPQWLIPWWSHFGGALLKAVAFYSQGILVGFAPMFIYKDENSIRKLCLIGSGISDYLDIIILPGYENMVISDFFQYLIDIKDCWDQADFQDLPEDSIFIHCTIPVQLEFAVEECNICPYLRLPSKDLLVNSIIPRKLRKNIGNYTRKLSSLCSCKLECASIDNYHHYLDELFNLHRARWEEKNEPGVLHTNILRRFHQQASKELISSSHLRIYSLRADERAIAVYYVLVNKSHAYAYLGGFDPSMEQYSPGTLALYQVIEDSMAKGAEVFDFMRGGEPYKSLWRPYYKYNYRVKLCLRN